MQTPLPSTCIMRGQGRCSPKQNVGGFNISGGCIEFGGIFYFVVIRLGV